jgi:hypothetical protein
MVDILMSNAGIINQRALECSLTKISLNIMHTLWSSIVKGPGFVAVQDGFNVLTGLPAKSFIKDIKL